MSYCISRNGVYYKIDEFLNDYNFVTRILTKCELILVTVDVVARDPMRSKEYDRYYVYELKPLKTFKPIYRNDRRFNRS